MFLTDFFVLKQLSSSAGNEFVGGKKNCGQGSESNEEKKKGKQVFVEGRQASE